MKNLLVILTIILITVTAKAQIKNSDPSSVLKTFYAGMLFNGSYQLNNNGLDWQNSPNILIAITTAKKTFLGTFVGRAAYISTNSGNSAAAHIFFDKKFTERLNLLYGYTSRGLTWHRPLIFNHSGQFEPSAQKIVPGTAVGISPKFKIWQTSTNNFIQIIGGAFYSKMNKLEMNFGTGWESPGISVRFDVSYYKKKLQSGVFTVKGKFGTSMVYLQRDSSLSFFSEVITSLGKPFINAIIWHKNYKEYYWQEIEIGWVKNFKQEIFEIPITILYGVGYRLYQDRQKVDAIQVYLFVHL